MKVCKIKKIRKIKNNSKKYDIQVKNNHNFFADNILVHNCTMYNDYVHARSLDSASHPSQSWVKNLHSKMGYNIPDGWRVCGENLYAKHTIEYNNLNTYFNVFSIWNEKNECLDWDQTLEWTKLLELRTVPIIYIGIWNECLIKKMYEPEYYGNECEGYVVRLFDSFNYGDYRKSLAKYVAKKFGDSLRAGSGHWRNKDVIRNKLFKG